MTSADVAKAAGVSRGAVSQILNGHGERFTPATRKRVEEMARALAYQPSTTAVALARGTSDVLVGIVPNATYGSNMQSLFDVLTDDLSGAGFTLVLRFSTSSAASLDRLMAGTRPRAVLTFAALGDEERRVLADRGVPVIEPAEPLTEQNNANRAFGILQAEYLVSRGYRRLAYAHQLDARSNPYGGGRLEAFRDRCVELGVQPPQVLGVPIDRDAAVHELRERVQPGVAIACYNDDVALTLIAAGGELGWLVPGDLAVIGVDKSPLGQVLSPRLTTIAYDPVEVAHDFAGAVIAALLEGTSRCPTPLNLSVVAGETT